MSQTRIPENTTSTLYAWQHAITRACSTGNVDVNQHVPTALKHPQISPETINRQLNVYRNNFIGARLKVIEQTFPRLKALLGQNYLRQCARHYLQTTNSHYNANLNELGRDFPSYLQTLQVAKTELQDYPWLNDLAALGYQLHSIYYAADDASFNVENFEQHGSAHSQALSSLRFQLSHSVEVFQSSWPIATIHCDISAKKIQYSYPRKEHYLCLYRQQWQVQYRDINIFEYNLLLQLRKNAPMKQLLEENAQAQQLLPIFIQRGWICGFTAINSNQAVRDV